MKRAEIDTAAALVKAAEERKRRRVSLALAAALVFLVVGGGACALWYQAEMARQDTERIQQAEDKKRQDAKLAVRREYLNQEVAAAVADGEQRRQHLLGRLAKQSQVNELLSDIDQWQRILKEARTAGRRARALVDGSPELVEVALAERLRKLEDHLGAAEKDWRFGKACDDARLATATSVDGTWNPDAAAQLYPSIFAGAGLDVVKGNTTSIAGQIKQSPIRLVYVAALDHWADLTQADPQLLARLFAIANAVDTDAWRKEFRTVGRWQDRDNLQELAATVDFQEQSPQMLVALARRLQKDEGEPTRRRAKDGEGSRLLRRAQGDHPRDFWIAFDLGNLLTDRVESEGYYRAALAVRPASAPTHYNLGNVLAAKQDVEGAFRHYRKALDSNPNFAEAHVNLGNLLRAKKDVEGALTHYRKALDSNPRLVEAHVNLGVELLEKHDVEGALQSYLKALAIDPNSAAVHINLGGALLAKKDLEGGIKHFHLALAIDPNSAKAYYGLGAALDAKKDPEGAIKHYRKAIAIDPAFAEAHFNLAVLLRVNKDPEGAIEHYRKTLELNPENFQAHSNLGLLLREKNDVVGAIKHLRTALDLNPKDAQLHANLAVALSANKDPDGAITHFRKSLELNPKHARNHISLGSVFLLQKNDLDQAAKHYRKAIDLDPNNDEVHGNLGLALHMQNKVDEAIKHYRKALELNPKNPFADQNLGKAFLFAKRDPEQAIKHFRKALDINPNYAEAQFGLGTALLSRNDVDGAIGHFRKAVDINPNFAEGHAGLAASLHVKKELGEAIKHYRKALDINPNMPGGQFHLARAHGALCEALLAKGQPGEARAAVLECLKLLPAASPLRNTAQQLLQRCDQSLALDKQLSAILQGKEPPGKAEALLALADLAQSKHYYANATRFYVGVLEKEPKLADDLRNHRRYQAASVAALAGTGHGKDADKFQEPDRAKFRQQALAWLRADLALWRKQSQSGNVQEIVVLSQKLPQWQHDPALASVRDVKQLAGLPKQEQEPWRQLWTEVAQLIKETKARFSETQYQGDLTVKKLEQVHEVKMTAGKTYVLDLQSAQFDTYLRLEDAKGKVLAENDDISPQDQNSRLLFSPKQAGVYRMIATSFQQQGRGAYTLTLREFAGALKSPAP